MTIADLCCVSTLSSLDYLIPVSPRRYGRLVEFLDRCRRLPYYQETNHEGVLMLGAKIQESLVRTQTWKQLCL